MIVYLDTSVILRKLLKESGQLQDWGDWEESFSSEIAFVESWRTLDRLRLQNKFNDLEIAKKAKELGEFFRAISTVSLSKIVLKRASESFPTIVGTLDAIHLASAILLQERLKSELEFLTHDTKLGLAAQAIGLKSRGFAFL